MKAIYSIVGMQHRGAEDLVRSLQKGERIDLIREPGNPYDPRAVQVWARGIHVGFVSKKSAGNLPEVLDARGGKGHGILAVTAERWPHVEFDPDRSDEPEAGSASAPIITEGRDV